MRIKKLMCLDEKNEQVLLFGLSRLLL